MKVCPECDAYVNDNEMVTCDGESMCYICRDELADKQAMREEEQRQSLEYLEEEE